MNPIVILTTAVVLVTVFGACSLDLIHNPLGHSRKFVNRRFINWFLFGITYALSYFGRYNINVLNQQEIWDKLEVEKDEFGWIITIGFWFYSVFVIMNGLVVDRIGARKALLIGCFGSGLMNLIMGLYSQFFMQTGTKAIIAYSLMFGINNYWQTFSTSAICKCGVNWYNIQERGFFSGIFGIIISFGFFLALQVNGPLFEALPWYWLFYVPAIAMGTMFLICLPIIRSTPSDAGFSNEELFTLIGTVTVAAQKAARPFGVLVKQVFLNTFFIILCVCELCIGWCRDGVLTWYVSYLTDYWGVPSNGAEFAIASAGITLGGMFGSLLAGIVSDTVFFSRRQPVAFMGMFGLTGVLLMIRFSSTVWMGACAIGLSAFFFSSAHGIVTSTCAMDFAGAEATGTAVGLLDGVQKIASGSTGFLMGYIIHKHGYHAWPISMIPATVLCCTLFLFIIKRVAPSNKN